MLHLYNRGNQNSLIFDQNIILTYKGAWFSPELHVLNLQVFLQLIYVCYATDMQ